MNLLDAFLPLGRTNGACAESPADEAEALDLMDRIGVAEALAFHTVARDSDPELGNAELSKVTNKRLHKVWAYDPAAVIPETPAQFLKRALKGGARAILVNPIMRNVRIDRSLRIRELAGLMEKRKIPLLAVYRRSDGGEDTINWYELADFCNAFPKLPVLAWEFRTRSNRPLFDALAAAKNLRVSMSSIWQAQMTETIDEAFGPRLVFSMGLPGLDPRSFIGMLSYAPLTDKARRAIAGETLRKLLREANYD